MSNLNLKGIWIQIEILTDDKLSDKEKIIYAIVIYLSKENQYCFLTNKTISELDEETTHMHLIFLPVVHTQDKKGNNIDKLACSEFMKQVVVAQKYTKTQQQNNLQLMVVQLLTQI